MATLWLSKLLSASSSIECFHGSHGLIEPYNPNLPVETVLPSLLTVDLPQDVIFPGIIHLSVCHGLSALEACKKRDVAFCALTRNPVLATDSQFQGRFDAKEDSAKKLAKFAIIPRSVPSLKNIVDEKSWADVLFSRCAYSVIAHLLDLEVNGHPAFRFEDYTTDYGEVVQIVQAITKGQLSDEPEIRKSFESKEKVNKHRKKTVSEQETWAELWSQKQRDIFFLTWKFGMKNYRRRRVFYPDLEALFEFTFGTKNIPHK